MLKPADLSVLKSRYLLCCQGVNIYVHAHWRVGGRIMDLEAAFKFDSFAHSMTIYDEHV